MFYLKEREVQRVNARTSHASDEVAQHHRDADPILMLISIPMPMRVRPDL